MRLAGSETRIRVDLNIYSRLEKALESEKLPSHVGATEADTCQSTLAGSKSQSLISAARRPGAKTRSQQLVPFLLSHLEAPRKSWRAARLYRGEAGTRGLAQPSLLFAGLQHLGKQPLSSRDVGRRRSTREFCPTSSKSLARTVKQTEDGGKPPPRPHRFGSSRGGCNHSGNIVAAYLAESRPATAMLAHEPFSCIFSRASRQHS